MPAKTRQRKIDPFAAVPGENGPARYNRLYAKALAERITIHDGPIAYNWEHDTTYSFIQGIAGYECTCPQGGHGNICKHITLLYPPQPYRQPCPQCSGQLVHRQEGTEHAVRCLNCHYVEQWQDSPPVTANASKGAALDYEEMYT